MRVVRNGGHCGRIEKHYDLKERSHLEEYRVCDNCNEKMFSGYVIDDGEEYFCDDDCLHAWYSEEEYDELCQEDRGYWTVW